MGYLDKDGLSRAFTKLKTLIDKKQDKMKTVGITSSGDANKNKWIRFATIDLSAYAPWQACSGTLSFSAIEGGSAIGILKFYLRNGSTAGVVTSNSINWVSLSDSDCASSVATVKVSNGKYDMYYKPIKYWETPYVSLLDGYNRDAFSFNVGTYVASITAAATSEITSYANTAGTANSVAWGNVSGKPSTFAPSSHSHNDLYYTEAEVDSKLSGKANSSHTHTKSQITDFPTSMPASDVYSWAKASSKPSYSASEVGAVPTSRTVNGKALSSNITLSAGDVGAAASSHSHNYAGSSSAGGNATWANGSTYANYSYNDKPITTAGTGAAYTASVSGLTLVAGASFVMVPHVVSTTATPTLNVNSLGAKNIRMRISSSTIATTALPSANFLTANRPVRMMYDGVQWVIDDMVRPDANNLYGTIISRGTAAPTSSTEGYIYIQTT